MASKKSIAGKIRINHYSDIISGDDTAVTEVPLEDLHDFKGHPFRVLDDEKMEETVESIREYGVLMPGIVRPRVEGGYEIISGHRRRHACEIVGLDSMPVLIKAYDDDQATIIMVDSNIQRDDILPSEKARAYKMKYDALKHQGEKGGGRTLDTLGKDAGESRKTIQRYIWLARLTDGLMDLLDNRKLQLFAAVEISFLQEQEQDWLERLIVDKNASVSSAQATQIKDYSQKNKLTQELLELILLGQKTRPIRVTLKAERLAKYFDENYSEKEIEETIIRLLDEWKKKGATA
ncbi:MAG: ParB/RepB/Spo0J family partition protein [Lachnospiraceae bacterium]|nr:ParB/RepB/Spo0J family partition protein [Lachnospiraceae bacterium]